MRKIWIILLIGTHALADYSWVQVTAEGFSRRLITTAKECPVSMSVRAAASQEFPVTVCESELTAPGENQGPIAILGDTGCRIEVKKNKQDIQDCNTQWPFAKVIQNIAASKPSFVIHVGDYVYRESACPEGVAGCANSPHGDNWETWKADFFEAAAPMLNQSVWLFMRGNHEQCHRNGQGWFRFFDPQPYTNNCSDYTEPYATTFANLNMIIMDNSAAVESFDEPDMESSRIYAKQFETARQLVNKRNWNKAWLLVHEPIWGAAPHKKKILLHNPTLQEAFHSAPKEIQFILSGHVHFFQALNFKESLPAQMIVGIGGVKLDNEIQDALHVQFTDTSNARVHTASQFGHVLLRHTNIGSTFDLINIDNQVSRTFTLNGNQLKAASETNSDL